MAIDSDISIGDGSTAAGVGGASMFGDYSADSIQQPDDNTIAALEALQLAQAQSAQDQGVTWEFDFAARSFVLRGRSVAQVDGDDALAQWCQTVLTIRRFSALAAPDTVGIEIDDVIQGKIPMAAVPATISKRVSEALLIHPHIASVNNFEVIGQDGDILQVQYDINTTAGTSVRMQGGFS